MTLHDVRRLTEHWKLHPPLRALVTAVAGSLGVKFSAPTEKSNYLTADEAMLMLKQTGGKIDGLGGM